MPGEVVRATISGLAVTLVLAAAIVVGSRELAHFDAALVGYTFATLFATFGITYRYAMWLQRPPTRVYWRRGWQVFFSRGHAGRNLLAWPKRLALDIATTTFIWRRSRLRWLTHMLIMWGCIIAAAITFPLVFGWLHFVPAPTPTQRSLPGGKINSTVGTKSIPRSFSPGQLAANHRGSSSTPFTISSGMAGCKWTGRLLSSTAAHFIQTAASGCPKRQDICRHH